MTEEAAADDPAVTLDVALLGRDYKVACRESERAELLEAVAFLDRRMREIRDGGKITSSERIAVMAALNIAHELQRARAEPRAPLPAARPLPGSGNGVDAVDPADARRRIAAMQSVIEQALAGNEKLS